MVRLQLEMDESRLKVIEKLMQLTDLHTKKEFINNALTLFKWAIEERQHGRQIASVDAAGQAYRELRMPALDTVEAAAGASHGVKVSAER